MSREGKHPGRAGERGIAMIMTVWLLAVLTVVVTEFVLSGRMRIAAERNLRAGQESYALAVAGYYAALQAVGPDLKYAEPGGESGLLLHYAAGGEGEEARREEVSFGGGTYSWEIEAEDGKININTQGRPVLAVLMEAAGMGPGVERDTVVDSILDWRDPNRDHRLNGAEEDYYRGLDPPYSCRDGNFDVPEELLLVRGVTRDLFYRTPEPADGEGTDVMPLEGMVTVFSKTFNAVLATDVVLGVLRRTRPPGRRAVPGTVAVTATGRGKDGPARRIRAVVRRSGSGSNTTFELLYWNDNYLQQE